MTGGTFRAISTAVIVLELTGDLTLQLPVAVSVVAAYFVANRLSPPLYDVLTKLSAVPHVPELPAELRQDPIKKWMRSVRMVLFFFSFTRSLTHSLTHIHPTPDSNIRNSDAAI